MHDKTMRKREIIFTAVTNCCAGHVEVSYRECVPYRSRNVCVAAALPQSHRCTTSEQNCIELQENRTNGLVADTTSDMDMVPT